VPNALSLLRLFLVPFTILLIVGGHWSGAFWLFVAAGVTDALDGGLARLFRARTLLGSWLDPVADKCLLVGVYVTLAVLAEIPIWLAVLVVLRDATILLYALADIVVGQLPGRPILISKVNTLVQIMLAATVMARKGPGWGTASLIEAFIYCAGFTTMASGVSFLNSKSRAERAR
jgi:cardiolipin synthase